MIKFGTSGWRAVMGAEFTFANVRIVVQAIANYLRRRFPGRTISVVVNYDTRFLSERYANEAAKILSHDQIQVLLSDRDAPSQALALQIIMRKAQAGINFTASFNPPEYNGLKLNLETGAPALPGETDKIEEEVRRLMPKSPLHSRTTRGRNSFRRSTSRAITWSSSRRRSTSRLSKNPGSGSASTFSMERVASTSTRSSKTTGSRSRRSTATSTPISEASRPPAREQNLPELRKLVLEKECDLGIATDADGDRFGILDRKGRFVIQNIILSLLLDYLVRVKGWRGGVARSVTTTHLIDRIARRYGLPLFKTTVGFKYMADLFLRRQIMFGGEESACIAVKYHLPEKDGIFAGLLVAEMMAVIGKSLSGLQAGPFPRIRAEVQRAAETPPPAKKRACLERAHHQPAVASRREKGPGRRTDRRHQTRF